jgi:hypothetical protein
VLLPFFPLFTLVIAAPAGAQLRSERVEGAQRICEYERADPNIPNEREVGVGESCPAYARRLMSSLPAPPTARLRSTEVRGSVRICTYRQLNGEWSFEMPLSARCPSSAGMLPSGG